MYLKAFIPAMCANFKNVQITFGRKVVPLVSNKNPYLIKGKNIIYVFPHNFIFPSYNSRQHRMCGNRHAQSKQAAHMQTVGGYLM